MQSRIWFGDIPLQSFYTAGTDGQVFFKALKDRGKLVGTRCAACEQVYVPARSFCERCLSELTEKVNVGPEGTLKSFTFCYIDHDGKRLAQPLALGLAQLDGATTLFLHRLLGATEPSDLSIGGRVRILLKPKAARKGSILDIEGFQILAGR
jgi:uncharacterized OB-fold protein